MQNLGIVKIKNQRHYELVRGYFECLGYDTRNPKNPFSSYQGKFVEGLYCGFADGYYDELFEHDFESFNNIDFFEIPEDFKLYSTSNVEAVMNRFHDFLIKERLLSRKGMCEPVFIKEFIDRNQLGLIRKK